MDLGSVLTIFSGLVGFPAFLAALINALKYFKVLSDGQAPYVNFGVQLAAYVAVAVAVMLGKADMIPGIDAVLGNGAQILLSVLAFLSSLGIAKGFNAALRGVPVIGYRHPKA